MSIKLPSLSFAAHLQLSFSVKYQGVFGVCAASYSKTGKRRSIMATVCFWCTSKSWSSTLL